MKKTFALTLLVAICAIVISCSSDNQNEIDNLTPDIASVSFSFTGDCSIGVVTLLDYSGPRFVKSIDFEKKEGKAILNHGTHRIVAVANDFRQGDIFVEGYKHRKDPSSGEYVSVKDTVNFWQSLYNPSSNILVNSLLIEGYRDQEGWMHPEHKLVIKGNVLCKIFDLTVSGDISIPIEVKLEPLTGVLDIESTDVFLTYGFNYSIKDVPNATNASSGYSDYSEDVDLSYSHDWPKSFYCAKKMLLPEEGVKDMEITVEVKNNDGEGNFYWTNQLPKFNMKRGFVTKLRGPIITDNGSASDWTVEMIPFATYYKYR